jgi:hypothetical protein
MSKTDKNQNKNKEPIYCINREISEEEAILSLAEGWSTAEPPTQEMLNNSYYKKAFERLKEGKLTWNWAAALGGVFWMLGKKIFFPCIILLLLNSISELFIRSSLITNIILSKSTNPITVFFFWFCLLISRICFVMAFFILGLYGNKILLKSLKWRYKKGYALLRSYQVYKVQPLKKTAVVIFLIFAYSFLMELRLSGHIFQGSILYKIFSITKFTLLYSAGWTGLSISFHILIYEKIHIQKAKNEYKKLFLSISPSSVQHKEPK